VIAPALVRQRHSHDCGIACMAMVMGCSLEAAAAAFDRVYPGALARGRGVSDGITYVEIDAVLAEEGYAIARLWRGPKDNRRRAPWPPEPFADAHVATVITGSGGHFVVLLKDGAVLDPATDERRTLRHAAYVEVQDVAAVVPLR